MPMEIEVFYHTYNRQKLSRGFPTKKKNPQCFVSQGNKSLIYNEGNSATTLILCQHNSHSIMPKYRLLPVGLISTFIQEIVWQVSRRDMSSYALVPVDFVHLLGGFRTGIFAIV